MKKIVLIFGGMGFVGTHIAQLLSSDYSVYSFGSDTDVRDFNVIKNIIEKYTPYWVVNCASITTVKESFRNENTTYDIGFLGTLNILRALKSVLFSGSFLNISSSEVYGHPPTSEMPIYELSALRPMSPYSVSKLAIESLCYYWSQAEKFKIVTARSFTHIGPGQGDRFSISNFTKQIAEIALKMRDPILYVGDLSTTRDFTDVRDVVRAYRMLLENGNNGNVYNVCSGVETSLKSILDRLISKAGVNIKVKIDKKFIRSSEQKRLLGSYDKLLNEVGWTPTIDLNKTVDDMFDHWLQHLRR